MEKIGRKVEIQTFEERLKIFDEFRSAKSRILSPEDFTEVTIRDKRTGELKRKKIILKSGWRKIKLFFGLSSEILEIRREKDGDKIIYICKARVSTQGGISSEAVGICSSDEPGKSFMNEYVLSSIAQTRAINKAIADLVGVDFDEELIEYEATREYETTHDEEKRKADTKPLPTDKNSIISQIYEMIKVISEQIPRHEILSRIKKHLNIDEKASLRISELTMDQLKEILNTLNTLKRDRSKTTEEKEELIF